MPHQPALRALLLENIDSSAAQALEAAGVEVLQRTEALDAEALRGALDGVHILGVRSATAVPARVVERSSSLLTIGAFCIGTHHIDSQAAASLGVGVFNAPFSNARSVVEMAIGHIIALSRHVIDHNRAMHAGVWEKSAVGSHEVRGRTLGIVGYGNIGSQLSVLAELLGMRVVFYDIAQKMALGNATAVDSLAELLAAADVVSLHIDGRAGNAGLMGAHEFAAMRKGALFLNLSRGFVIDHGALKQALQTKHLAGAAIDVFSDEPKHNGAHFESDLQQMPNVILTPHVGGSTQEAQRHIGTFVASRLMDFVTLGTTTLCVNLPALTPAPLTEGTRLMYVHRNTPGVMAAMTTVLSQVGGNIARQVLGTQGDIGYAVTDLTGVDASAVKQLNAQLTQIPATIKVRWAGTT